VEKGRLGQQISVTGILLYDNATLSCHNRLGPLSFRGAKQSRAVSQLLPVALVTLQLSASPQGRWDMQQAEPRANAWLSAGLTKLRQGCCLMTQ